MRLDSRSETETERLGEALAPALSAGDLVALEGPLGAGKTRFVQGVARGLGVRAHVRSPRFTLVNQYRGRVPLVHVDLYRLEERDVDGLALDEALNDAALVVEWAERLPRHLRQDALEIEIAPRDGEHREFEVRAHGARAEALRAAWQRALAGAAEGTR